MNYEYSASGTPSSLRGRVVMLDDFYIGSSYIKMFVPFGAIPLSPLFLSLTIATHAVLLCSTSRDHCFVIASEGVIKK